MEFLTKLFLKTALIFSISYAINNLSNIDLLKIEASFIPKVILMDYGYETHLKNNAVEFVILYDNSSYINAKELQSLINEKFNYKLTNHDLHVKLLSYDEFNKNDIFASVLYLFGTNAQSAKKAISKAIKKHILTFTNSSELLDLGAILSLKIGKKVQPIINIEALKESKIELRPILLKISLLHKSNII